MQVCIKKLLRVNCNKAENLFDLNVKKKKCVIIDSFWAMLRAVELFSSSTNLSVILNDCKCNQCQIFGAVMVILKLYTICSIHLHFIQHFSFF